MSSRRASEAAGRESCHRSRRCSPSRSTMTVPETPASAVSIRSMKDVDFSVEARHARRRGNLVVSYRRLVSHDVHHLAAHWVSLHQ